ncbi:Protein CBG02393 [Caenorhabditis briggsae]|uniref:Uncharacterized protein n=2 Tax=Caenorhabditis briggsae TaxID=6238 RepID=A0AAE9IV21_CAEBR|nr:Protein CBG02393 [Caenorhabditis briggsae]ULU06970.1 hypothetical protein L3Y34_018630 [Caenorhabditis briggsae]UMM18888.1 hypothetical protein L5515_014749 [Caenorhabditis briggsae]CAP24116.2 Protein CBG02393 [Caenorhabditis briggsae]
MDSVYRLHSPTISEASFEFVKTESDVDSLLQVAEKSQDTSDAISLKSDISSNVSEDPEVPESDLSVSEEEEKKREEIVNDETSDDSEKSLISTGNIIGDSMGLTVEIPEINEKPVEADKDCGLIMEVENVDVPKGAESQQEEKNLQADPLGVIETPILRNSNQTALDYQKMEQKVNTMSSEIEKLQESIEKCHQKVSEVSQTMENMQAETRERAKGHTFINESICGEWRLLNMEGMNEDMKADGVTFPNRVKSLVAHTRFHFDGYKLRSHQRLFCKVFGHSAVSYGKSVEGNITSNTFLRGNMMVTDCKDARGVTCERTERYVADGHLHISHINSYGERNTLVYERVRPKVSYLLSIGNVTRLYCKFWQN